MKTLPRHDDGDDPSDDDVDGVEERDDGASRCEGEHYVATHFAATLLPRAHNRSLQCVCTAMQINTMH